jgi:antitoxin component YwqK of YwqJK toxin-antitoxin module
MKPTSGGYIIDSNLYDSKDKLLGTIKNGIDFYYIDFINEWDQKSRMYINKVDQMYENVVEKRTYTVGMINLKKNEREGFTYLDHLFVDCNSDKLCILTGAIQMIKWHTREKTPIELLPDQIFIDTNYVNSIKGNNSHIVPFKSFHISSNRYYTKDGNTWYQDEQLPWTKSATYEIYSVDDKNLYLRQLTYNSSPVDPKSILIVPINVTTERNKYMTYPYYLGSIKTGYTPYSSYETYLDSNDVKYTENTVLVAKPKNSQVNSSDVVQDGIKVTYRKEGDLESRIEYKNGVMNGVYERYYQGNLEIKGEMNNGVIVGRWEYYIDVKGNYLNGKLDKKQSGIYENGKKVKNL